MNSQSLLVNLRRMKWADKYSTTYSFLPKNPEEMFGIKRRSQLFKHTI